MLGFQPNLREKSSENAFQTTFLTLFYVKTAEFLVRFVIVSI